MNDILKMFTFYYYDYYIELTILLFIKLECQKLIENMVLV